MRLIAKMVQQQALVAHLRATKLLREENHHLADRHARETRELWNKASEAYLTALKVCQELSEQFLDDGPDKEVEE